VAEEYPPLFAWCARAQSHYGDGGRETTQAQVLPLIYLVRLRATPRYPHSPHFNLHHCSSPPRSLVSFLHPQFSLLLLTSVDKAIRERVATPSRGTYSPRIHLNIHPHLSFFGIYIIIHTLTHRIFALHQRTSLNARLTLLDGLISLPLPIFSLFLLIPKQPGYSRALHSPPSPFLPPFKPRCKLGSQCVHYLESPWPKRCYFFISLIYWWSAYS